MFINNHKGVLLLLAACMAVNTSLAQTDVKIDRGINRKKSLVLYLGGGVSQYTAPINTQPIGLQTSISRVAPTGTIKIMWHPQYRLRLGVESGYVDFYSYKLKNGNKNGNVRLSAVPVLVTWSMVIIRRLQVFAGFGSYFFTTRLNYEGSVKSSSHSLGSNIALSYVQPISKNLGISAEAKWMDAFQTKDHALSLQLQMRWKFLEW
ncbi:MAG: hypothetical protein JWP81_3079 [Ferruginibacter sp.]|nr:hypothetical protein [Ferruginibacter sp.]